MCRLIKCLNKKIHSAADIVLVLAVGVVLSLSHPLEAARGQGPDNELGKKGLAKVTLISFTDWQGFLLPFNAPAGTVISGVSAEGKIGGLERLAAEVRAKKAQDPERTLIISSGDAWATNDPITVANQFESAIDGLELLGVDVAVLSLQEFNAGQEGVLRLLNGDPDGSCCFAGRPFDGADFDVIAANITVDATGDLFLPARSGPRSNAYVIKEVDGVKVGIIGINRDNRGSIGAPVIDGLTFQDPVTTVNALVPELKAQGVETIVVLFNEGIRQDEDKLAEDLPDTPATLPSLFTTITPNTCLGLIPQANIDQIQALDSEVDVVINGNGDPAICEIDRKLVVSSLAFGGNVATTTLYVNRQTGEVIRSFARNGDYLREDAPLDPFATALINDAITSDTASSLAQVVGRVAEDLSDDPNFAGETELGSAVADGALAAAQEVDPSVQIAFENPGGIRLGINFDDNQFGEMSGEVTQYELEQIIPFQNGLVVYSLSFDQLVGVLEDQFDALFPIFPPDVDILHHSNGFQYAYDDGVTKPDGSLRIDRNSLELNGVPLDPNDAAARYRVVVNRFMAAAGGAGPVLVQLYCQARVGPGNPYGPPVGTCFFLGSLGFDVAYDPVVDAEVQILDSFNTPALGGVTTRSAFAEYLQQYELDNGQPLPAPPEGRIIRIDPEPTNP